MKTAILTAILAISTSAFSLASNHHLEIELSSKESHNKWIEHTQTNFTNSGMSSSIEMATSAGIRLHEWLDVLNSTRKDNPIKLTSSKTRKGYPIENPKIYSPTIVQNRITELLSEFPPSMKEIIFEGSDFSAELPEELTEETFIKKAYLLDRIYQAAVRWETVMKPSMRYYKSRLWQDVRGIYGLKKLENLVDKLENFDSQTDEVKSIINYGLKGICVNNRIKASRCETIVNSDTPRISLYKRYIDRAERNWQSFFKLQNPRRDVVWESENEMKVTFADPKDERIASFLKDNIEDEFRFGDWRLSMEFVPLSWGVSRLEFKSGVTPHVNKLGGNIITMDKAASIDEYDIQWTIRHEYGHVIGLPDCYFEFYDEQNQMGVSYQIDTTDLMCSRAGNFNERLYKELKSNYYRY